jgi:glyoxylase-like metal-dependent hydrolase (beta-lactamase superfamily II)
MHHVQLAVGPLQCNCHILACEKTREGVIIDPGDDADRVIAAARDLGIKITALLHTHAHFDHITGTPPVHEATQGKVLIHRDDRPLYDRVETQARTWGFHAVAPAPVDQFIQDGDVIRFGTLALEVLHTPGHTPGSCCFRLDGPERRLFSGDTLFARSIGRTDLWGGNHALELQSIREKLLPLDPDTVVHPGHGPSTHIGAEKKHNPFLAE